MAAAVCAATTFPVCSTSPCAATGRLGALLPLLLLPPRLRCEGSPPVPRLPQAARFAPALPPPFGCLRRGEARRGTPAFEQAPQPAGGLCAKLRLAERAGGESENSARSRRLRCAQTRGRLGSSFARAPLAPHVAPNGRTGRSSGLGRERR